MKRVIKMLMMCVVLLAGCSSNEAKLLFTDVEANFVNGSYEALYTLLSNESQQVITQEEFVTKYSNIYSGIQASNIQLKIGEIDTKNQIISFSLTMDTIAGPVNRTDFKLPFVKEDGELRVVWSEALIIPSMQSGDKVRVVTKHAMRGTILDRNDQPLASDGLINTVGIHPAIFDLDNREIKIQELARALDISEETITKKLEANSNPDHFVPIVDILPDSARLESLQNHEKDGILIRNKESRIYRNHEAFGRLLGYVGPITAEQLEADKDMVYKKTSIIGKAGLEQVYEPTLRGFDGVEIYIEREGANIETLALKEAQHGTNIKLSIDSILQAKVYDEMKQEKGSATAVDPKTGEILALVSSPSYNSNRYTTYISKSEQQHREDINFADETNRFTNLYSPGSTFKLITAATGLESGAINPTEIKTINGMEWQKDTSWGNYNIRRINAQNQVGLKEAIKYSDNIYFGMSALAIGVDAFVSGAEKFTIGTELTIGYPLNQSQISNKKTIGNDILLADSGYGQGEILVTTLNMALAYSTLSNNGNIMNPTLILNETYQPTILKESVISPQNLSILQDAFFAAVEDVDGTGHLAKINDIKLAGKTGTAEIKSTQGERGRENGWFVATDLDSSKVSIAVVVEDVQEGLGTLGVVSMVKEILADYLK